MEEMSIFALKSQSKELLGEYLKRVLLEKPEDPIDFLIKEIKSKPFSPPQASCDLDGRSEEEKMKWLDLRREETKIVLLKEIWEIFDPKQSGTISRAKLLLELKTDKSILLGRFPKHKIEIPLALELVNCGNKDGNLSWERFAEGLLKCLAGAVFEYVLLSKYIVTIIDIHRPRRNVRVNQSAAVLKRNKTCRTFAV
jgi:hypothetical protein